MYIHMQLKRAWFVLGIDSIVMYGEPNCAIEFVIE